MKYFFLLSLFFCQFSVNMLPNLAKTPVSTPVSTEDKVAHLIEDLKIMQLQSLDRAADFSFQLQRLISSGPLGNPALAQFLQYYIQSFQNDSQTLASAQANAQSILNDIAKAKQEKPENLGILATTAQSESNGWNWHLNQLPLSCQRIMPGGPKSSHKKKTTDKICS